MVEDDYWKKDGDFTFSKNIYGTSIMAVISAPHKDDVTFVCEECGQSCTEASQASEVPFGMDAKTSLNKY